MILFSPVILATYLKWVNEPNGEIGAIHDVPKKKPTKGTLQRCGSIFPTTTLGLAIFRGLGVWGLGKRSGGSYHLRNHSRGYCFLWALNFETFFKKSSKSLLDMVRHDRHCSTFLADGCHFFSVFVWSMAWVEDLLDDVLRSELNDYLMITVFVGCDTLPVTVGPHKSLEEFPNKHVIILVVTCYREGATSQILL